MEQFRPERARFEKKTAAAIDWQGVPQGSEEAVRAIGEQKSHFGVRVRQPEQNPSGIDTDSRQVLSETVCGIER
jgi:hypothetical protein